MSRQELLEVAPHIHLRMLADLYRDGDFDVIHSHVDIWTLAVRGDVGDTDRHDAARATRPARWSATCCRMYPQAPLVSISDDQRRPVADLDLNWVATVPHGLDLDSYLQQPRHAR